MTIKLPTTGNDVLLCPHCGGDYLHQRSVIEYARPEDAGFVDVFHRGQHKAMANEGSGNPSPRRHGLLVPLWCELCHTLTPLRLFQHKGNTMLGWDMDAAVRESDSDEKYEEQGSWLDEAGEA